MSTQHTYSEHVAALERVDARNRAKLPIGSRVRIIGRYRHSGKRGEMVKVMPICYGGLVQIRLDSGETVEVYGSDVERTHDDESFDPQMI